MKNSKGILKTTCIASTIVISLFSIFDLFGYNIKLSASIALIIIVQVLLITILTTVITKLNLENTFMTMILQFSGIIVIVVILSSYILHLYTFSKTQLLIVFFLMLIGYLGTYLILIFTGIVQTNKINKILQERNNYDG